MNSLPILCLVFFALGCSEVKGTLLLYGEQIPNHDNTAFLEQLCPKPNSNDRKYVRIKTFNNKYVWAYTTHKTDNSYLRTRCCGGKDAVGRKDITIPGRYTTFMVHCKKFNNQNVVRFEILNSSNRPSGYYFYADPIYNQYGIYAYKPQWVKAKDDWKLNFIIHRWKGPVVAIRSQGKAGARYITEASNWLTASDVGDGRLKAYNKQYRGKFPSMEYTFSLEAVPDGCVNVGKWTTSYGVWAAPSGTSKEECESRTDTCYWSDGWQTRNMKPAVCYYSRDSGCYQSPGARINRLRMSLQECEAKNHCFNYKTNHCYDVVRS